ncbi:MAG TPA: lytic transglycosylase domain-containing protein [Candidatus Acidoferrales bacterium]|nr:lytic transglycosylase domain-containing protein [Candidatus Acidoferrales bacterium]
MVQETAEKHRVDPALVRAVISAESNWDPFAVSPRGALGLMQLIPGTAVRFGVGDVFNPQQNLEGGVKYLRSLLERYNGDLNLSLAAYNAGERAVDRAHGVPHFAETQNYVQKVIDSYFRPDSGRDSNGWRPPAIRRDTDERGRVIFTNE